MCDSGKTHAISTSREQSFCGMPRRKTKEGNPMNVGYPVHEYQVEPLKTPVPDWTETEPAQRKVPDDEPVPRPEKMEGQGA
jgi:hypothetical protein